MTTPGLKLIQDLLAKSVAKWSAPETYVTERESKRKRTEDEPKRKKKKKISEGVSKDVDYVRFPIIKNETKIEYTEPQPVFHYLKLEVKDEKYTDKSCETANIKREVKMNAGENKSFIKMMLEKSIAKYEGNQDGFCELKMIEKAEEKKVINSVKYEDFQNEQSDDKIDLIKLSKAERNENAAVKTEIDPKNVALEIEKEKMYSNHRVTKLTQINDDEDETSLQTNNSNTGNKYLRRDTRKPMKKFSPEEDEILEEAIATFGDTICIGNLAKQMHRSYASIRDRLIKLRTGKREKEKREFSLIEDLLIMEKVLESLPGARLKELSLHNDGSSAEVAKALGRKEVSPRNRWENQLKPWILQHYSGTLNFDIRRILANYLAENFDSFDSIDWLAVAKRPEFVGHTQRSLRAIFFGNLFKSTKVNNDIEHSKITLKDIADNANVAYSPENRKKITENVLKRQEAVIDYFEKYVKKHGITNFL